MTRACSVTKNLKRRIDSRHPDAPNSLIVTNSPFSFLQNQGLGGEGGTGLPGPGDLRMLGESAGAGCTRRVLQKLSEKPSRQAQLGKKLPRVMVSRNWDQNINRYGLTVTKVRNAPVGEKS